MPSDGDIVILDSVKTDTPRDLLGTIELWLTPDHAHRQLILVTSEQLKAQNFIVEGYEEVKMPMWSLVCAFNFISLLLFSSRFA